MHTQVPLTLLPAVASETCTTAATCSSTQTAPPSDNTTLASAGAAAQIVVWIFDEEGRGLEGKSVHLWVKPDSPDYMDESVLFQPGNPRVGVRAAALQELGGGRICSTIALERGARGVRVALPSYGLRWLKHCPEKRMGGTETRALGVEIVATRLSRTPSLLMVSACPRCSVCVCEREWVWEGSIYA